MSFDLCVFHTEKPHSDDDGIDRYMAYGQEDDLSPWIEPNPRVAAFLADLTAQYPDIDDVPEQNVDECPWAAGFDASEGHVVMPMVFSWAERMYPIITGLAEKHGLVCFDPQEGKIVAAPPGIHVEETDKPPVVIPENPKNPAKPLADTLNDILKPLGYERKGRYWRKDGEKAVIALEAYNNDGIYEVWFYAWFKDLGEIEPSKVKSGGEYHLFRQLDSDFLPERFLFRLQRAFNFTMDSADSIQRLYDAETASRIMSYYEPREPLTATWRAQELSLAMTDYVLPFFTRIEAGEHEAIFAEEKAKREKERLEQNAAMLEELRLSAAICQQWVDEGLTDDDLITRARKEFGMMFLVALSLSLARGWTLAETEEKMTATGLRWTETTKSMVKTEIDDQECLILHPDGHVELLPD